MCQCPLQHPQSFVVRRPLLQHLGGFSLEDQTTRSMKFLTETVRSGLRPALVFLAAQALERPGGLGKEEGGQGQSQDSRFHLESKAN